VPKRGLPQLPRERDVLSVIDMLITEKDHLPAVQGCANFAYGLRRQRPFQVDAEELGAGVHGHWPNREHGPLVDRYC
jgi:hypothetical protein